MTQAGIRLRPLTVSDLLDEMFRIYRSNLVLFAGLAIAVSIPTLALQVLAGTGSVFGALLQTFTTGVGGGPGGGFTPSSPNLVFALLQYPMALALLPFQTGTLTLAAVLVCLGQPATIVGVFRAVLKRYFGLWLLNLLLLLPALLLVCLPLGIWLLVRLSVALPAVFAERAPATTAVERSWRLTARSFWRTFGVLALILIANYVVTWALTPLLFAVTALLPGLSFEAQGTALIVVTGLMGQIVLPLYAIAITLIYFDLRVRKEAFDLEMQAYRLGAAAAVES